VSITRTSVYLDYNATAPMRPEAREALLRALESPANPSSVHAAGRAARDVVERARAEVGALVGTPAGSVTFVSGGTEANALAIQSAKVDRIIISAIEHDAVTETAKVSGLPVEVLPVDGDGVADLQWLAKALEAPGKMLVCLMLANNETGVIQPVAEASALVRGGQERGRRAGTENVAGIASFGAAAKVAHESLASLAEQAHWRDALAQRLKAQGAVVLGESADRLPQTLCFAGEGFGSEVQVMNMDLAGVMVSAGSACSSGKVKASRVVEAMGRSDLAPFALRVSGGWASTEDDWIKCGDAWLAAWKRIGARRREVA
jgi:cysteine desulfurase